MNPKKTNPEAGFTIIELLTVMSIIVVLISILVPALNRVKRYARDVRQRAQFHAISVALEQFAAEHDGYPPSDALDEDTDGFAYCGAMKLAEAMVGQDLRGFHPDSRFRSDGTLDGTAATRLYRLTDPGMASPLYAYYIENTKSRRLYLQLENANAAEVNEIYSAAHLADGIAPRGKFLQSSVVLCDVYNRVISIRTGKKIGMPILYYKANTNNSNHKWDVGDNPLVRPSLYENIYNRLDNQGLVDLPLPWDASRIFVHPMASGGLSSLGAINPPPAPGAHLFYFKTRNLKVPGNDWQPYRADSYILMSAGFDGEYGTPDDIFNFGGE